MIPKNIIQTFKNSYWENPGYVLALTETWKYKNEDWRYLYFSDAKASELISSYSGQLGDVFNQTMNPQVKGDILRLVAVYVHGGFYADIDTVCYTPLSSLVDLDADACLTVNLNSKYKFVLESCAFSRESKLIKSCLDEVEKLCKPMAGSGFANISPQQTSFFVFDKIVRKTIAAHSNHETTAPVEPTAKDESYIDCCYGFNCVEHLNMLASDIGLNYKFYEQEFAFYDRQNSFDNAHIAHLNASCSWKDSLTMNDHYSSGKGTFCFEILKEIYEKMNLKGIDVKIKFNSSYWA